MSRKIPQQNLPHYGVKNNLKRQGNIIRYPDVEKRVFDEDGGSKLEFVPQDPRVCGSVSKAKRFMRTGKENRR